MTTVYYVIQIGWIRIVWGAKDRLYRGPLQVIACLDRFREADAIMGAAACGGSNE